MFHGYKEMNEFLAGIVKHDVTMDRGDISSTDPYSL